MCKEEVRFAIYMESKGYEMDQTTFVQDIQFCTEAPLFILLGE
jgi:hypothetical protein